LAYETGILYDIAVYMYNSKHGNRYEAIIAAEICSTWHRKGHTGEN
jgi:hypothetical protein